MYGNALHMTTSGTSLRPVFGFSPADSVHQRMQHSAPGPDLHVHIPPLLAPSITPPHTPGPTPMPTFACRHALLARQYSFIVSSWFTALAKRSVLLLQPSAAGGMQHSGYSVEPSDSNNTTAPDAMHHSQLLPANTPPTAATAQNVPAGTAQDEYRDPVQQQTHTCA